MASNGDQKQPLLSNRTRYRQVKSCDQPFPWNFEPTVSMIGSMLGGYFLFGTLIFFICIEDVEGSHQNPFIDAMYVTMVTMTTVGYGDLRPDKDFIRLFAMFFILAGMSIFGLIIKKAAEYVIEKQEMLLIEALTNNSSSKEMNGISKARTKCNIAMGAVMALMLFGFLILIVIEQFHAFDAFYCVLSTVTTVGYGDLSFDTPLGRFIAVFWMPSNVAGVGLMFLYAAELCVEKKQKALVHWVLAKKIACKDLESADIDNNGYIGADEFILYKLKQLGKVKDDDILILIKRFKNLDVDASETLSYC